jgi:hypothetical protein
MAMDERAQNLNQPGNAGNPWGAGGADDASDHRNPLLELLLMS